MQFSQLKTSLLLTCLLCLVPVTPAMAWGQEGHRIVALIAQQMLTATTRQRVAAILGSDEGSLTKHDIASEATWADAYKYSGRRNARQGAKWHYINLEIKHPDMDWACYGHPQLPGGTPASAGASRDCIVDKINQFESELAAKDTAPHERLLALKYVLHLVGDLHQPLHAADNHDRGGNDVHVSGITHRSTSLHHAWDSVFVGMLGKNPERVASSLLARISDSQRQQWQQGTPMDWAWESWRIAKSQAYGRLPNQDYRHLQHLNSSYVSNAKAVVAQQLSKAGVRLAWLLNRVLGQ